MKNIGKKEYDPNAVKFRHDTADGGLADLRDWLDEINETPIATAYIANGTPVIIDGHHRARVAQDYGLPLRLVTIDESIYERLRARRYDDDSVSCAMLMLAGESDWAESYNDDAKIDADEIIDMIDA